jgi:hypothetical protein
VAGAVNFADIEIHCPLLDVGRRIASNQDQVYKIKALNPPQFRSEYGTLFPDANALVR